MKKEYDSFVTDGIRDYIELKVSLGYSKSSYEGILHHFDRFCAENYPNATVVTEQIVTRWTEKRPTEGTNGHIRRMIAVNGFLAFLKMRRPDTYTIPDGMIGGYKPFMPYLYSDEELDRFFLAADTIPPHPVAVNRELIYPVIFRMLYCCGLRPHEPLRLKRDDVDLAKGTVYIADSKIHKDRIVTLSDELRELCSKYDSMIRMSIPGRTYFFQRPDNGDAYGTLWLDRAFRLCIRRSGLSFHEKHPRVYDWRHNFATRVIHKWMREGRDVAASLPYLSTYMGHSSISSTAYYIHLVPNHLEADHMNEWEGIPEVPAYED